jgi:hypothetical protein
MLILACRTWKLILFLLWRNLELVAGSPPLSPATLEATLLALTATISTFDADLQMKRGMGTIYSLIEVIRIMLATRFT